MDRFRNLYIDRETGEFHNTQYLTQAMFLYLRWQKFLDDDFAHRKGTFFEYFVDLVERISPFFWVIVRDGNAVGFMYLENITGCRENLHCAEVIACFDKSVWGKYTKESSALFIKFCFEELEFTKLKALIYPENSRVKTILRQTGFTKEATLKAETQRRGKPQDIDIYSLWRD